MSDYLCILEPRDEDAHCSVLQTSTYRGQSSTIRRIPIAVKLCKCTWEVPGSYLDQIYAILNEVLRGFPLSPNEFRESVFR
jgi:hypothetical protein